MQLGRYVCDLIISLLAGQREWMVLGDGVCLPTGAGAEFTTGCGHVPAAEHGQVGKKRCYSSLNKGNEFKL